MRAGSGVKLQKTSMNYYHEIISSKTPMPYHAMIKADYYIRIRRLGLDLRGFLLLPTFIDEKSLSLLFLISKF